MASKKSKILAMALCASVMTGIYASPVMAAELWHNVKGTVVTDNAAADIKVGQIKTLEGLEKITLGDSVRIIADDGGIIRVGDAHGVNTRVHDDGFYINKTGSDRNTSLTAGILTLAGNELTSAQLANINNVIGVNGVIKAADGSTVGGVKMKAGRVSGKGFIVRGSGNALGTAGLKLGNEYLNETKLGAINDVITEEGAVKSKGDVTSKAADGKTYSLNTVGNNTSGITIDSEGKVTTIEGAFSVDEKGYIYNANRSFQVTEDGAARFGARSGVNVRMENGVLSINSEGTNAVASLSKDGLMLSDSVNGQQTLTAAKIADIQHIKHVGNATVIEENLKVYHDGTIVGANNKFSVTADGTVISDKLNVGNGNFTVSDEGIGAFGSQFTVNTDGEISTTGINVAEGMFTASDGGVTMARGKMKLDTAGNITAGTYNGVKIGMNVDGDIILGDGTVIDNNFNSDNVAGITRKPLDDSAPGGINTTYIEQNTAISADGIVVKNPGSGVSTKTKYDGFYVKDKNSNIVSSLKDDGLMLTNEQSGRKTLNATDIADIKGIDRSGNDTDGYKTTIEGATSFTKDGMVTSNITTGSFTAGVTGDSSYRIDANGEMLFKSGGNYIGMNRGRIGFTSGTESVTINGEGTTFTSCDSTTRTITSTIIKGGTIKTGTLEVENIKLGDSMTDKNGNTITIGAAGVIDIEKEGNKVFHADTDNFGAHYNNYDLTLDGRNGFALSNGTSKFTLKDNAFAFEGPVHLGDGTLVEFRHNGTDISLSSLVNRVENLEEKTQGISFDETTGSTTIADKVGTDGVESNNSMTVGNNGTTFENGEGNGTTNINGGAIYADSSSIGNDVSGGSGSGSSGSGSSGTYTDGSVHTGYFEDGDNSYEFTNDADGFTGTVTDGKHTTTIENGAKGSNTTVTGEGNTSASSGVGIGNDGAFISDSVTNGDISHTVDGGSITDTVTNGDMTVTEVKDENGSATTVKDANGSSTVSQKTNGQTVSTGTGTSVNTGDDFSVTDNDTGKSIYMSDIGHVEDIDSEIQNSDGSKTTVVDAVNNEAEIRRNEIERVDGRINNLENRVGKLEDRVDKVGAMAAAIANLRTMGYDPAAPTEVAVGIGQYRDETGAALGLFHYPNRDFMLSLSVSTSGDEVMGGIGATWKFGRKSPEKVAEIKKAQAEADARRAEEAKLAKAEEMKQAAKEAKIKAQQERHAKLAAQAEAAK